MRKSAPGLSAAPGCSSPPRQRTQGQRAALGHEALRHRDVLAARADHAHRVPRVDDLVVALGHQAQPPVERRLAVVAVDGDGEHVPLGVVDARGERPAPAHHEAAVGAPRPPGGERDGGGHERVGVGVPHLVLRLGVVEREDPVVGAQVADVPRGGRAAAPELGHDVHHGHEGQLHAAEGLRLMEAEQAGLVQKLLVVAQEDAGVLAPLARARAGWARWRGRGASPRRSRRRKSRGGSPGAGCPRPSCPPSPRSWPSPPIESQVRGGL